jgi:hypothetical protein
MHVHSDQVQQQSWIQARIGTENSIGYPPLFE